MVVAFSRSMEEAIMSEGAFYGVGRICLRRGAFLEGRRIKQRGNTFFGGFYLVERRHTSWEIEGAWQGRNHLFVKFCMRRGRT
jgi:hypothetical protein